MKERKEEFQDRSMLYEIENEKNPYKRLFLMTKWYSFLVETTLRVVPSLEERLKMIRIDTEYMQKRLPTVKEIDNFVQSINKKGVKE